MAQRAFGRFMGRRPEARDETFPARAMMKPALDKFFGSCSNDFSPRLHSERKPAGPLHLVQEKHDFIGRKGKRTRAATACQTAPLFGAISEWTRWTPMLVAYEPIWLDGKVQGF